MASENQNNSDDFSLDDFSLESILAEYKGTAYINGDKKTPVEILDEQTDIILKEALDDVEQEPAISTTETINDAEPPETPDKTNLSDTIDGIYTTETLSGADSTDPGAVTNADTAEGPAPHDDITPKFDSDVQSTGEPSGEDSENQEPNAPRENKDKGKDKDNVILFFENYRPSEPEPGDTIIEDVEKAIERELGYSEVPEESSQLSYGIYERSGIGQDESLVDEDDEEEFKEPELKDALRRFTENLSSISLRVIPAAIITLMMAVLTFAAEAGMDIPFSIGRSRIAATGALMISLLIVMMLCVDLIVRGATHLVRGVPNAETLLLFSCLFSYISGAFTIIRGDVNILPYCAVSAISLTLSAFGEKYSLRAITDTIKTALVTAEPYGVQAEYNEDIDKSVLKKVHNRVDGFYSNLMHPDVAETAYRYAAPILLAVALILSIATVIVRGRGEYFLHILSAMLAAATPFSIMLTFSFPFGIISRTGRKAGAAIAGWGGVDDICFTDGAGVTDDDLFPPGTLSFNGVKVYERIPPEKLIRYTASLIIASGSGLSHIFSEVLRSQRMDIVKVDDFVCYEGGIGAMINGEHVVTGSAAFMNLLGFRIPDDMNMKNAVFTAIDEKLTAMFSVDYLPVNSVQSALISMLKWRIKLFFAMRDFNITPLMLEQKFRVSLEDIEYIQAKDSYNISDSYSGRKGRMAALLTREGLGPFAEAITGGRLLKSSAVIATAISVISAALGVVFMFYMCWNDAMLSAQPGNLILFMLSTFAAVLVVCGYVKCRK